MRGRSLLAVSIALLLCSAASAQVPPTRQADVIYGRVPGAALTFDVFTPAEHANGLGVIVVVSGGWASAHESIDAVFYPAYVLPLTHRGYTVFCVVHGSQPLFTIPEILPQISRAVRFIRVHAADYHVDPDHLGITGGSAGGHLSLMQGVAPLAADPNAADPVDHASAAVQSVAAFFPPTDFLNYGKPGEDALGRNALAWLPAPFAFRELNPQTHAFAPITDEPRIRQIGRDISPIYHATSQSPPTLIIHGDADPLVPLTQARAMIAALQLANVECKLIVKPGAGHGWPHFEQDVDAVADWFDQTLRTPTTQPTTQAAR